MHVMVEGIDGSGKHTIIKAFTEVALDLDRAVFDVTYYSKDKDRLPDIAAFEDHPVILTAEPTYAWVGKFIREEITRKNDSRRYSARFTALQYSSDRIVHYKMVVLPALESRKIVIQERGSPSSFCYQPIQDEGYPLEELIKLDGNQLSLQHQPDLLIIAKVEPEKAMQRLKNRRHKNDTSKFEDLEFLKKLQPRYEGPYILFKLFDKSEIVYLDTNNKTLEEINEEARDFARKNIFVQREFV